jgi:hypothetical protein
MFRRVSWRPGRSSTSTSQTLPSTSPTIEEPRPASFTPPTEYSPLLVPQDANGELPPSYEEREARDGDAESPSVPAPPPTYSALDSQVTDYTLHAPMIICPGLSARYHLSLERTAKGKKPFRIMIRRLLPTESRRLSRTLSNASSASTDDSSLPVDPQQQKLMDDVRFDRESTMYMITKLSLLGVGGSDEFEIKGCRASTVPGHIHLSRSMGRWEFWHYRRNPAGDALRPENRAKMEKWGYKSEDEWTRTLLFTVGASKRDRLRWRRGNGVLMAAEEEPDGSLSFVRVPELRTRDLLVTCWVARRWSEGTLEWAAESLGRRR